MQIYFKCSFAYQEKKDFAFQFQLDDENHCFIPSLGRILVTENITII